jgi:hypothetical protein
LHPATSGYDIGIRFFVADVTVGVMGQLILFARRTCHMFVKFLSQSTYRLEWDRY